MCLSAVKWIPLALIPWPLFSGRWPLTPGPWPLLERLPFGWWSLLFFLLLSTLTLLFSMIVASRVVGGIDFGLAHHVAAKSAAMIAITALLGFFDCGILLVPVVWRFGLMLLFGLSWREAKILIWINSLGHIVWKILLLAWTL